MCVFVCLPASRQSWLRFLVCELRVAWHLLPCDCFLRVVRASKVCGTRGPLLLGTCYRALVVAGGVPLRRATSPCVVRRASSSPVALGALIGTLVTVVPCPTWSLAPGLPGQLRGARGGRPRARLLVPCAGSCRGRSAEVAPRRTRPGPGDRGIPALRALRLFGVCQPSHSRNRFPVPSVFRQGPRLVNRGCFVWTPTPPLFR